MKSLKAALGVVEPDGNDFGIGALALLDIAQCQNAPQLPSVNQYKKATIGTYRAVTLVRPATATSVVAKLEEFKAGKAVELRQPLEVFPAYRDPAAAIG